MGNQPAIHKNFALSAVYAATLIKLYCTVVGFCTVDEDHDNDDDVDDDDDEGAVI